MKKQLLNGLATVLFPFGAYAASSLTASNYARTYSRKLAVEQMQIPALHTQPGVTRNQGVPAVNDELSIVAGNKVSELIVLDEAVPDKEVLLQGLNTNAEVVFIKSSEDGLEQLVAALQEYGNLEAIHFMTHAKDGEILLGNSWIAASDLKDKFELFSALQHSIKKNGDILFYGCDLASGEKGGALLEMISGATQRDVAASSDLTGSEALGGDWDLEIATGSIEASHPFSDKALRDFSNVLTTYNSASFCASPSCRSTSITSTDGYLTVTGSVGDVYVINSGFNYISDYDSLLPPTYSSGSLTFTADGGKATFQLTGIYLETSNGHYCNTVTVTGYHSGGSTTTSAQSISAPITSTLNHNVSALSGLNLTSAKLNLSNCDYAGFVVVKTLDAVNFASSNTAPTISNAPTDVTVTEDTASNLDLSAAVFADADGDSLTVTLAASAGILTSTSGGSVTVGGSGTGTLTLSGAAGNINTFLDTASNIQYTSASNASGNDAATLTITPNDGTVDGTAATINIDITDVNDEPTLTATGSNPTFTEGGAAASLYSSTSVSTVESGQTLTGLTVTVTNLADGSSEILNADGTAIALTNANSGTTATNSLSYSVSVSGSTATVTFSGGTLSTAAMQALVDTLSYQNNADDPDTTNRVVTLTSLTDSGSNTGANDNVAALAVASTVTVTAINDEPTLTATGTDPTFTEGGSAASLFSSSSASTIESGQTLSGLTLTVTNLSDGSSEILNADGSAIVLTNGTSGTTATNSLSYSAVVAGSTATVTFSGGTVSAAALQTLVDALSYQNNASDPGTSNRVVTITSLTDSGSNTGSNDNVAALAIASTVTVTGVNDEPTLTATGSNPTFTEGGAAASLFSGTSVSTIEAGQTLTGLTLTVTNLADGSSEILNADGTAIALTNANSGTTASNSLSYSVSVAGSTATVSFSGATVSAAGTQTLVDALSYQNNSNDPDTTNRVVTITSLTDSGSNTGSNDNVAALAVASTVTVTAINDEPTLTATGSNPTFTEGGSAASLFNSSSASTVESGQTLSALTLTVTNVADGSNEILNADGTAIALTNGTSGTTATNSLSYGVSVAGSTATVSVNGGTLSAAALQTLVDALSYQNNSQDPDTTNRVVTLTSLQDSGGTANGGDDTAALSLASTTTVAAVNDQPTDINLDSTSVNQSGGVNAVVGNLSSTDVDNSSFTYTLVAGTGDTDNSSFNINGSQLRASNAGTLSAGNYSVRLQTNDGANNYQEAFTLTVVDDVLPSVSSVSVPANSTYTAAANLDFTVNYSEAVTVNTGGGTPRLVLTVGATTRYASYISGSGSSALAFRHTVNTGDVDSDGITLNGTLDTNGGALTDAAANTANTTLNSIGSLTSVLVDAQAPTISETVAVVSPGNDSTPNVSFTTDEAGTLAVGGSCGSASEGAVSSGANTIALTQTDNTTPLADGTYSNCSLTVSDAAGNASNVVTLTSFTIDATAPSVAEVTPVTTPGNDSTPSVTFSTNETGTLSMGGTCGTSSSTTISATGNHTITLTQTDNSTALTDATYSDCTITITDSAGNANSPVTLTSFVVDTTAPSLAEVTAVTTPGNDTTPNVTVSSNEAGTLVLGGSCGTSSSTSVSSGNNTLTLTQTDNASPLGEGTFSNCTVTVTDAAGNASSALNLTSFTVDTTAPSLAEVTAVVTPGNDNTPDVTISSDEDGTLAIGGSCGSASEGAANAGNITLALTQTDNSTALSDADYNDCTATITDAAGNASSALALSSFVVDTAAPTLAEVTPVTSPSSDNTPDVVFSTTEDGTVSLGGSCGTSTSTSVSSGNNTLTLTAPDNSSALSDTTYSDCTLTVTDASGNASSALTLSSFIVDIAAPTVAEVTAVTTPGNDTTPRVTISSSEAGTLAVGGSCGSSDEGAISAGNTTITLTGTDNSSALADGSYSNCTVIVTDAGSNASNTLTLTAFTIDASAPSLGTNASLSVNEGDADSTIGSSQLSASDNLSDAANTTYTLVSTVSNGTLRNNGSAMNGGGTFTQADLANNLITYDHDGGETASDSFTFTLSDGLGNINDNSSANFNYSISVTAVNDAPSTTDDSASTNEDNAVMVDVLANDADSDDSINAASVTVVNAPSSGSTSINTGTGVITYTPGVDFNGSDSFTYTVQDASGATSAEATVSITVNAVNDAPVASNDMVTTDINTAVTIDVAANDSDVDTGDSIDTTTLAIISSASNGSAVVNAGQIDYTPNTDYLGSDSFSYTIDDGNGATSNVATVTISVIDPNTAPSAANDSASTDEDNAVIVNVLSNDDDPDGSLVPGSISVVSNASNGSTSVNTTTGAVTYTPAADFNGSDSFTYTVEDDIGAVSSAATVTITVASINDAPVANNDMVTLLEDASLSINVLGNDSDVDGTLNAASLTVVTNAVSGVAVLDGNNILYTPLDDFAGSDSFTYTVEDNDGLVSNTATVTLTVDPVNDAPLANNDSFTIVANVASVLDIISNDSDIDGTLDAASISIATPPNRGTLSNNNDGTVSYTPNSGVNPLLGDSFSYTIDDNSGATSTTATVTISFEPASVPVLSGTPDTEVIEGESYSFVPSVSGADSLYVLTFSISNAPVWASFDTTSGELSGTPVAANVGTTSSIVISVSDGVNSASLPAFDLEVIADVDSDGDTISDHQEDLDGTDPGDPLDYLDITPPEVMPPADILVDASALFTPVTLAQVLSLPADATQTEITQAINDLVSDNVDGDGCCDLTPSGLVNGQFLLPPGDNVITWWAEDFMNNTASVTQHIYVRPLVTFSKNQVAVEGSSITLRVLLNGNAPFYPFEVPYVIDSSSSASDSDHDLTDGSVIFEQDQISAEITINVNSDNTSENDETLVLRLDDRTSNAQDLQDGFDADIYDINAGVPARFTLTIVERNVAPKLRLSLQQNGVNTIQVTPNGGDVTVTATVTDPNVNDSFTLDWAGTDTALSDISNASETYVFSPTALSPGRYKVKAKATDSDNATNSAVLHFRVVAALPTLSAQNDADNDGIDDASEGTADSDDDGIPDYLDNIVLPNVLPEQASETNSFLVECDPGVRCRLGEFSIGSQSGGAHLNEEELTTFEGLSDDKGYTSRGIFDFELADLPEAGQTTSVVIPQLVAIPANAVYRKFANGEWRDFAEDANNLIHSTAGSEGFCPPPGDDSWQPGLTEGHWCVQLTIEDGGPNDADGEMNNSVADPGGVATRNARTIKTGGGSFGLALLIMLGALLASRRFKKSAGGLAALALVMLMPGETRAQDYPFFVEASVLKSASTQSASDFYDDMASNGVTTTLLHYDSEGQGYQFNLGYQYNTYLAAMVGYIDLGKADVELEFLDEDDSVVEKALEEAYPHLGKGLTANARFSYPLDEYFNIYADLGINIWQTTIHVGNSDIEGDVSGVGPWGGVGAKIQYKHWSVRFAYQVFKIKDVGADTLGFGIGYAF